MRRGRFAPRCALRRMLATAACGAVAALLVATSTARAVTGPAGQSLDVTPTSVVAGHSVTVSGKAPSCQTVTLLSRAFPSTNEFAGVPAVGATSTAGGAFSATITIPTTTPPGSYSITARACGGNLGLSVSVTVRAAGGAPVPAAGAGVAPAGEAAAAGLAAAGALLLVIGGVARRRS